MSVRIPTPPGSRAFDGSIAWAAAVVGPAILTLALIGLGHQQQRDYVFLYLGLVAILGVFAGLWPTLLSAAVSFLCVDYFFAPPVGTPTIADQQDIVNLLAFLATAGLVGKLGSWRRRALLQAEALAIQLEAVNVEVILGHRNSRWTPWDTTRELIRSLAGMDVHILRKGDAA